VKDVNLRGDWEWGEFEKLESLGCRVHNGHGPVLESKIDLRLAHTREEAVKTKMFLRCDEG
jgi:hypothetical protein